LQSNIRSREIIARRSEGRLRQQQDCYHWRLHVQLILSEATERLARMEATAER
jgi:hypothetical protein